LSFKYQNPLGGLDALLISPFWWLMTTRLNLQQMRYKKFWIQRYTWSSPLMCASQVKFQKWPKMSFTSYITPNMQACHITFLHWKIILKTLGKIYFNMHTCHIISWHITFLHWKIILKALGNATSALPLSFYIEMLQHFYIYIYR
jgi:hypothetical protein